MKALASPLRGRRSCEFIAFALLACAWGGCCSSAEATHVFERGIADEGKTCERVCREAIVSELSNETETFDRCEETQTDQGASAVLCHYVDEACTTELH